MTDKIFAPKPQRQPTTHAQGQPWLQQPAHLRYHLPFRRSCSLVLALLVFAAINLVALPASAQADHASHVTKKIDKVHGGKKFGHFVAFPIPIINPTIGYGLAAAAAYLYKFDEKSQTSGTGIGALYTDSHTWGVGIGQLANFKEDAWKIKGGLVYFNLNVDFYGIGSDAGDQNKSIPINEKGIGFGANGLRRIAGQWYVGLQYWYVDIESTFDLSGIGGSGPIQLPPEVELDSSVAGLGLVFEYDSKDNEFNAYKGQLFNITYSESNETVGSDFDFSSAQLEYNIYLPLNKKKAEGNMTLALRGTGCATPGDTPFYALCRFGSHFDLRGYVGGRYRDKTMLTVQGEYRWRFTKKWGAVAFAGVGEVAESISDYNGDNLLPSAGVGLRFMLSTKDRLNICFDYAIGKDTSAAYFYVAESF